MIEKIKSIIFELTIILIILATISIFAILFQKFGLAQHLYFKILLFIFLLLFLWMMVDPLTNLFKIILFNDKILYSEPPKTSQMILSTLLFCSLIIVFIIIDLMNLIYFLYLGSIIIVFSISSIIFIITETRKEMDDQRTIKIYQIKTIPEDEMYFSPYLENLFIQYNTQKNYLIIKVILIFCIVLSLLAGLLKLPLSSPVVFIVDTFEVFLVVFLGLLTIIILINLLNKGSLQKEFLLFISAHNNHNLQTLYEELQVHELQIKKDDYNERNTPLYDYFRAISKINEGKYQETIELLNKSVNQVFNSFAIKYELLKLLGICFLRIGENEKSQKCFIDATAGFRKIHFLEPISNQDLKDGYLIDGKT